MTKRLGNAGTTGFLIWSVPGKEGGNQDMVTGVDIDPVPCYVKIMTEEQPKGNLRITKTATGTPVPSGFQFEVRDSGGTLIGTYTTDSTGIINIPNLSTGSYSIREINIPSEYIIEGSNPKTVSVFENSTTGVDFRNIRQQGQIVVHKVNSNPGFSSPSLAGAQFEIWNPSGSVLYGTITTNSAGVATSDTLWLGDYVVKEKVPPTFFIRNQNSFPVTLSAGSSTAEVIVGDVTVPNAPQPGRININKSNSDPSLGSYSLAGARFGIYDVDGGLLQTITTDSAGKAQSGDLPLSTYYVRELNAPYGFVKNGSSFTAQLVYAGPDALYAYTTVDVPERPQTGIIRVHKTNSNPSMGDYALNGAVFEVRNSSGALVDTITSNSTGLAQTKELPLGSYRIKEVTAPWGFVLNTNEFTATLSYATDEISTVYADVTIPNRPQTGTIRVTKLDKDTGATAQGDATLNGAIFEVYASDKTTLLDTLYCGTGSAATSKELKLGTYYYREKNPPIGYLPDVPGAFYEVKIEYAGQNVTIVEKFGDLKNQVIRGQIALTKHTDQPMEGYEDNPQVEQPLPPMKLPA